MIRIDTAIGRVYTKDEVAYEHGDFYVGVTTVLDCLMDKGLKEFFINNSKSMVEKIRTETADAGTALHSLVEKDLNGETYSVEEHQQKAFDIWTDIKTKHHIEGTHTEIQLVHNTYGYSGTADVIGNFTSCESKKCCFNKIDGMAVMDLKTGTYKVTAGWQIAAYRAAAIHMGLIDETSGAVGLHVHRTGKEGRPYVMQHIDPCFETFLSALQVWKFLNFNALAKMKWQFLKHNALRHYYTNKQTKEVTK